jgi:ketosteroid isomerase-like protein
MISEHDSMNTDADLVDRLLALWRDPPADDADALAAFRALYTDPVDVNGVTVSAADLLARARILHRAYSGLHNEVLDVVTAADRVVIAFRMLGTHTGPLPTPVGTVAPTGRPVSIRTIDVLTVVDGRITRVIVVGDELGALVALGAVGPAAE